MTRTSRAAILWLSTLLTHAAARAQQPADTPGARVGGEPAPHACFRPGPPPRCRSFWITEFGVSRQITPSALVYDTLPGTSYPAGEGTDSVIVEPPQPFTHRPRPSTFGVWELGGMVNRGVASAVGASAFLAVPVTGEATAHYGLRARYRWWSVAGFTVDVNPGAFVSRDRTRVVDRDTPDTWIGLVLQGVASRSDLIRVVGEVDLARGHSGARVGAHLGSIPGAVAGVLVPAVGMLLFVLMPGD